jgi:hypothetical protein
VAQIQGLRWPKDSVSPRPPFLAISATDLKSVVGAIGEQRRPTTRASARISLSDGQGCAQTSLQTSANQKRELQTYCRPQNAVFPLLSID